MLKDAEILKLYLFLVCSEWDSYQFNSFRKMRTSIQGDFSGVGMGRHWAGLVQFLDYALGQLDRWLGYLKQHDPDLDEGSLQAMKYPHKKLRHYRRRIKRQLLVRLTRWRFSAYRLRRKKYIEFRATFMCVSSPAPVAPRLESSTSSIPLPPFHLHSFTMHFTATFLSRL